MIVKNVQNQLLQYIVDQANFRGSCEVVYIPENPEEIKEVVNAANKSLTQLTVCGNHTSLTGSSVPLKGWVLSTERLNRILEINVTEKYVVVEPGVVLKDLQQALRNDNLFLPPDPTEDNCFVGGMVATNASGARSYKYGAIRNFVEEMDITLPHGRVITLSRSEEFLGKMFSLPDENGSPARFEIPEDYILPAVKNNVGYSLKPSLRLIDAFIGSEGTLGIINRIKLRVVSIPEEIISLVMFFYDLNECFSLISDLKRTSMGEKELNPLPDPRSIEFYDSRSLNMLRSSISGIPDGAICALWMEQEVECRHYDNECVKWLDLMSKHVIGVDDVWMASDNNDKMRIINMRHQLPIFVNELMHSRGMRKIGTDVSVPEHVFEEFYNWTISNMNTSGMEYVAFGHFGDCHLHLNILPRDESEVIEARRLYKDICFEGIRLKGTFSAEHGVGKIKKEYLLEMLGKDSINFMKEIKDVLDPNNILNTGNIF